MPVQTVPVATGPRRLDALALLAAAERAASPRPRWAWWIDGDLSAPDGELWGAVSDLAGAADVVLAERAAWAPPGVAAEEVGAAIDPLAARNLELAPRVAGDLVRSTGAGLDRPFVLARAQADGWSEAERALAAVRAAREAGTASLGLVLAAAVPAGDPRAWRTLGELADHAAADDDVLVVPDVGGAGDAQVNALQRLARVALVEREDEAPALEALWKRTPVVAAERGAEGAARAGAAVAELVADPGLALERGTAGRDRVRASGLVTRLLADQLALYARIVSAA